MIRRRPPDAEREGRLEREIREWEDSHRETR